ncbi:hypothetical protein M9458_004563, partial [Cirrhinus mrigala]
VTISHGINCLEMLAAFRALKHFLPDLRDRHVLVRTDNTAVVYYINHQGGLRSCPLYKLAHQILVWSQDKLLSLRAVHVPGHINMGADILSSRGFVCMPFPRSLCSWEYWRDSPVLAGPGMVLGPDFPSRQLSMGDSRGGHHPPPPPGAVEVVGVAPEGAHLIASGLSTEVVKTILQSRASSTKKLYALKWRLFTSWCGHCQQDPVNPLG